MTAYVMDSSVAIAILKQEEGYQVARPLLPKALISAVNLTEVVQHIARSGHILERIHRIIQKFPFTVIPYSQETAELAGALLSTTQSKGLSLGDRACLALGITQNLPVLTADKAWAEIELPIEVRLIR